MKTSTKLIAAVAVAAALFTNTAKAQVAPNANPWKFGIGLETGLPTGALNSVSVWELGGTARLQYNASKMTSFTLTSGFYNFFAKSYNGNTTTIGAATYATSVHDQGMIPIKAGVKEFLANNFYVSGEAGVGLETQYGENTKLLLTPGVGFTTKIVDLSVRYENFSGQHTNYGLIGLRIAYGFGL